MVSGLKSVRGAASGVRASGETEDELLSLGVFADTMVGDGVDSKGTIFQTPYVYLARYRGGLYVRK